MAGRYRWLLAVSRAVGLCAVSAVDPQHCAGDVGSLVAGVGAYLSVRFLVRYFETRTLTPFAIYCVVAEDGCLAYFSLS